ncbi:MAG: type II toxin-antitoxin system VapB family antitoxin [Alphaproteobacteria bacterium]|nr:type II toxin-antitoxin system VapB family antitoxin [Alphaproteobacteria bacterium]
MRTTLAIDDDLLARAQRLSGVQEKSAIVSERRLASPVAGVDPDGATITLAPPDQHR